MKLICFLLLATLLFACSNDKKSTNTVDEDTVVTQPVDTSVVKDSIDSIPLDTACITGTFYHQATTALLVNPRRIVLNKNGTGQDIYTEIDKRKITWTLKDGKLYMHSAKDPQGGTGREIIINCKTAEISVYGELFGKNR